MTKPTGDQIIMSIIIKIGRFKYEKSLQLRGLQLDTIL